MLLPFFGKEKPKATPEVPAIPVAVNLVLQDYLSTVTPKVGRTVIDDMLQKKFAVDDSSKLNDNQRTQFLNLIFERCKEVYGFTTAKDDLEKSIKRIIERYGMQKGYLELLEVLPRGVLETEKLSSMGREDLEKAIWERTRELEEAKSELEKTIKTRTEEFETEKNKFRLVLYNTVDGVFALDKQKKIIAFNKAMEDLSGYLESEVLGNPADDFIQLFDGEGTQITSLIYSPVIKLIEDRSVYKAENILLKGRNNKEYHVNLVSSVISEVSGTDVGCIVTLHDVSSQKELETMKLDFVSIAAHELRTPLTSIRGYLSLLISENEAKGMLTEEQRVYLERSYLSSNQLFALVENLLNVSRIERGSVVLDKEPVEWAPLVDQIVQSFVSLATERKVQLSFVPVNSPSKVLVDAIMIGEVLSNLLDNAIRYTGSGGTVLVFLEVTDKTVITHVKDTGQGIPQESIPHLFSKFYRVSGVLEQGSKGTGLGLYISKEIVKLHGGEIWVESELNKGSVFSFSVPRAQS